MYSIALDVLLVTSNPELAATLPVELEMASQGRVRVTVEEDLRDGFDVALVDLGERAADWLTGARRRAAATPLIVLGTQLDHVAGLAALRCGAQDYLSHQEAQGAAVYRVLRYAVERHKVQGLQATSLRQQHQAQKMEAVGRLAAGIVHDFRHMIQIVLGNCSLLLRQYPDDPELQERLGEVKAATAGANALVDRLLGFAREGEHSRALLTPEQVLDRLRTLLRPLVGHKVQMEIVSREPQGRFWANQTDVDQILLNLAVNAVDAMPAGGHLLLESRTVEFHHELVTRHTQLARGRYAALSVCDSGQGISPELLERVLEPFFTTKAQTGTGLGLSTAFTLANSLGGGLILASEPGLGTAVCVLLPADEPATPSPAPTTAVALLLDSDPSDRVAARVVLELAGYSVLEARTLQEADRLCSLCDEPPALAVVDAHSLLGHAQRLEELTPQARSRLVSSHFSERWLKLRGWLPPGWRAVQKPWGLADLAGGSVAEPDG